MRSSYRPITPKEGQAMRGKSFHDDIPSPPLEELAMLDIPHWDFSGEEILGNLVTTLALAEEVLAIFARLYAIRFPIEQIRPMVEFAGSDDASMAANNSSCFNARVIRGTHRLSDHALGQAIDINPVQNPVIRDGIVRPEAGNDYLNRELSVPGIILKDGPVVQIFADLGWKWGGNWENPIDYHHFYRAS